MRQAIRRPGKFDGRVALGAALVLLGVSVTPARAQFSFFGPSEASPQDIYETIADHGFRLVGPLYRNGRVYLADVIDRRQRRERLVIAAESGQIIQRFLVSFGGPDRQGPPAVQPALPRDDSFFSHLTRGWDDDAPPRPPVGLDGQGNEVPPVTPLTPSPRRRETPRVVTRTETGPVPPPVAVTATPLPSASPQAPGGTPQVPAGASQATKPDTPAAGGAAPSATPPVSGRGTTVSTDPLRIPGTRPTEAQTKPGATTAVATKVSPNPAPVTPPAKPAVPSTDVPVAPLD